LDTLEKYKKNLKVYKSLISELLTPLLYLYNSN
jgi:hypothetical protein